MAGQFAKILRPQYSLLTTADLGYTPGTGDAADTNPFNPDDDRPLVEGEWLQRAGTDQVTRGGNNAVAVPGTPDSEGTVPAFLHFNERGRTDAQVTRRCHIITGPLGFEFSTKLCDSTGLAVNSKVAVFDLDFDSGPVRRVLALQVAGYIIGYVTRVYGTDHISVWYNPQAA
jgi:hypothetical protein